MASPHTPNRTTRGAVTCMCASLRPAASLMTALPPIQPTDSNVVARPRTNQGGEIQPKPAVLEAILEYFPQASACFGAKAALDEGRPEAVAERKQACNEVIRWASQR